MKRLLASLLVGALAISVLAGCSGGNASTGSAFDSKSAISVITREEGSGARGAFIELMGIEVKNPDGTKKDRTTTEAITANKTDLVLSQVASGKYSIGYVSLGSVNDTVKALKVDGIAVNESTIKDKTYKIWRPFIVATNGEATGIKKDFIDFILSKQGQAVAVANNTVNVVENAPEYKSKNLSGKLVVAGSSSVTPLMEKLKEAYVKLNPKINVEVQMSDSSAGIQAAINKTADIAMTSRKLKDGENLIPTEIALDGIAVIVNKENPIEGLSADSITKAFTGEITVWSDMK
ncbi:MAG: substrate-binding domain-containing protein [Bacillota bacterium]